MSNCDGTSLFGDHQRLITVLAMASLGSKTRRVMWSCTSTSNAGRAVRGVLFFQEKLSTSCHHPQQWGSFLLKDCSNNGGNNNRGVQYFFSTIKGPHLLKRNADNRNNSGILNSARAKFGGLQNNNNNKPHQQQMKSNPPNKGLTATLAAGRQQTERRLHSSTTSLASASVASTSSTCSNSVPLISSTSSSSGCLHPCNRPEVAFTIRSYSTMRTQQPGSLPEYHVDPYHLLEDDLKDIYVDMRQILRRATHQDDLYDIATYYLDGNGKALRPMVAILMARAVNYHLYKEKSGLLTTQREVAMIAEMIHTASLVHDDVVDQSDFRRSKPSVNVMYNHKKVTMAGDYILAVASMMIARLRNDDVTVVLSQVVLDLVNGEFMQLGSKETENERFPHYLTKTYRKTASLIANSVKSVTLLAGADDQLSDIAYQYGRNLGLGFQLIDDLLDFVSSTEQMGKPTAADLKLGLATAPVLFACEKYPELNPMIMRRFQEPGDVERAFELVHKSQGLDQTHFLAKKHCQEAARLANMLAESPYQKALIVVTDYVLNRMK